MKHQVTPSRGHFLFSLRYVKFTITLIFNLSLITLLIIGNVAGIGTNVDKTPTENIDLSMTNLLAQPQVSPQIGIDAFPNSETSVSEDVNIIEKLRDNENAYTEIYNPWKTKAANHVAAVTEDGEYMAVGGGFLLDTEIHVYRWNIDDERYEKVSEAGSGEISGDIYDLAFEDLDNNGLLDIAAVSGDGYLYIFEQESIYDPYTSLENRFELVWKSQKLFQAKSVDIFDTDLDGIKDVVVGSWDSKIHVYEYVDHSGYPFSKEHWMEFEEKWVSDELEGQVESVKTGDFNGNGLPDIIAGTFTGELYIFENDGLLVPTPLGDLAPLPNDDDYREIWSQTGVDKTIWKTIGAIEAEDVDGDGFTEAVILGWGQGAWMLKFTDQRDFYLEQLMVPFEFWEEQGFFPLDYFGDRLVAGQDNSFVDPTLIFVDTPRRSLQYCVEYTEPSGDGTCYNAALNTGLADAPDGIYTEFRPNSTHTAFGVWDMGVGEEVSSNGNTDPDLYIAMKAGQVTPTDWNITLSNNLDEWYTVDPAQFSVTSGSEGDTLALDLDVLFSTRQIESMRYVRLELINRNAIGDVDSIIVPYPGRPLTLAVSANIHPLNFLENGISTSATNKIIFGGTDGRLIVFDQIGKTGLSIRDVSAPASTVTTDDTDYGLTLQTWSQVYDSYKDDQFKTDKTIWSIYPTPKGTVIPIWRYYDGGPMDDFSLSHIGGGTEKAHFMQIHDIHPFYSGTEVIVSSNDTSELFVFSDFYGNSATEVTSLSNLFFSEINAYNFDIGGQKILTFAFGEFDSDDYLEEVITFAWYKDPSTLNKEQVYDQYLLPLMWRWDGSNYDNEVPLIEESDQLYAFLSSSVTYPSADTGDFNNDGKTDIVLSNGRLAMLWNTGTLNDPKFELDLQYFETLNDRAVSLPIYQPNAWDFDEDGDIDILYSYGRDNNSRQRYGLDFFENLGNSEEPNYERTPEIVKNPSLTGSFFANDYTYGSIDKDTSSDASAYALWVYNPITHRVRQTIAEIGGESSFIVGSNPEIKKLEINKAQTDQYRNYGYTVTESWNNRYEYDDWTVTLRAGELDGDEHAEIVISDFDNNVYVFENLLNNTYKRAFKTFDLNHTVTSDTTPYFYEELEGLDGKFTRSVFDHGTELIVDIDLNGNGRDEFIIIADLSIYIFENTGFNDAYTLLFERDYAQEIRLGDQTYDEVVDEFSAIAYTDDFDGRGPMIALGANYQLFLLRYSSDVGFVESFASIENQLGITGMFGTSTYPYVLNHIDVLRFADVNQDGQTELWAGGYTNQLFSNVKNGFVLALESNYSDYAQVYSFSSEFTTKNPVNTIEFDDLDYDGQLEMVIGHSYGVDIYEAAVGSEYDFTRVSVISSDPGYAASEVDEVFTSINSPQALGARKHAMVRLSNDNYVVVMGRDQVSSNSFNQFVPSPTSGELYFDLTSDPEATELGDYTSRVGTDPLTTGVISSGWERVVIWESDPKVIEGSTPGTFYITWVSYSVYYFDDVLQYSGVPYYNVHIAEFDVVGALVSSQVFWDPGIGGEIKSPTIALQPSDTQDLLLGMVAYDLFYAYDIDFDGGGSSFNFQASTYSYALGLEYYFDSVDLVTDISSGIIGIAFSAKQWQGGITHKIYYAEYTDSIFVDEFSGIWQLNADTTTEVHPSILFMPDAPSDIIIMYERVQASVSKVTTSFSSDAGRSWSDYYNSFTDNPNLIQIDEFKYQTLDGLPVFPSQYSPQMTIDANGQIEYQLVERFLIFSNGGGDSNYGDVTFSITFFGATLNYQFATQMFIGSFENSNFFDYQGISDVRDIAIGDSDRDGRKELFLSHGNQVSLVEISGVTSTLIDFTTKFQSERYLRDTGGVEIYDTNNNGIPELIYSVKGGDVFFLELTDIRQPKISTYYITELSATQDTTPVASVEHIASINLDEDNGIEYVTASIAPTGTIEIFDDDGSNLGELVLGSIQDLYYEDGTILALTSTTVYGLDTQLNELYTFPIHTSGNTANHLIDDIDNDGIREFVFLQNSSILAIEIGSGNVIFDQSIDNGEINGFTDVSSTILDGVRYYSAATQDADRYTVQIFNENGESLSLDNSYYFNTSEDRISHEIGDFDGDGELEITLYRYYQSSESFLQLFDLTTNDLFTISPISNITLPIESIVPSSAPDIKAIDTRKDGTTDIILWTNQADQSIDLPSLSTSALYAIDMSSSTLIWSRTLSEDLDIFDIQVFGGETYFVLASDNLGTFVLSEEGVDVMWLDTNSLTSDISFADFPDTIRAVAVRITGITDIFTNIGLLKAAENIITPAENKVVSQTIQYYKLKGTVYTSYSNPVDINRDGAFDLFVGFSNGTMALRNYELGEYWRIDVDNFDTVHAEDIRYGPNQNGLAISYDPGYLVVFDRISTRAVINVSNDLGVQEILDMKKLTPDGQTDYLLLRTKVTSSTTGFHLFNPIQQKFIWNYTTGGVFDDFDIVFLDNTRPNYPTHIAYGVGTISLIQLPTTLLTSGQIQNANDGSTWVDYKVTTTDEGLSKFYLISSSGDLGIFTVNLGQVDTYEEEDLSLSGITHFSLLTQNETTFYLIEQETISHLYLDNGTLNYMFNISQSIYSTDELNLITDFVGDSSPELLLYARNALAIYDLSGDLLQLRTFSSGAISRQLWYPDLSGHPVLVTDLFNENLELIDPIEREYSTNIAAVSVINNLDLEYQEPGEFVSPEATWPEYQPSSNVNPEKDQYIWLISIPLILAVIPVVIRRFRQ